MKKIILTINFLLIAISTFPDWYITRGPNQGEVYFLGLTYSGEIGLYHSTDYGQTAQCMDSTIWQAMRITADKTPGVVYYVTMVEAIYKSDNYGTQNSWQYVNNNVNLEINSGVAEGLIYNAFISHSEDYGFSFIPHSYNGFFGSTLEVEIDIEPNVGYVLVNQLGINDSVFLLRSVDNFENLELQYSFHKETGFSSTRRISRGVNPGELFFFFCYEGRLFLTHDYGASWIETNKYNKSDIYISDMVGGRTEGEIYNLYRWSNLMGQNAHTYILYSTDYGITYEVFHPFAKGIEPLLSQFSAKSEDDAMGNLDITTIDSVYYITGDMPLNVQFYNYSIGDIIIYEWDFNNDGVIDSYEESPVYTYADTGWYSVSLTVYDDYDTNSFLRENYIYVYELTDVEKQENNSLGLICHPNPFKDKICFTYCDNSLLVEKEIVIYNMKGKMIKYLS
ncbi:MAG: PKD domain-containing protein, partial [Bacteroidales bacterium]